MRINTLGWRLRARIGFNKLPSIQMMVLAGATVVRIASNGVEQAVVVIYEKACARFCSVSDSHLSSIVDP